MTKSEERKPLFEELFATIEQLAQENNAQIVAVAVYPKEDEDGQSKVTAERVAVLEPEKHEASAIWMAPIVHFLEVYFRDRPPTRADYEMLMSMIVSRRMDAMSEEEAAEALAHAQAASGEVN
jgi:hypothetical protein